MTYSKGSNNNGNNSSSKTMTRLLASTVLLALCPAVSDAFVVGAPQVASAGSAWTRQDPVGLGAPTGAASQRLGAGGAPSRIGDNNNDAATKKRPAWVYPLQAFKGLEVRAFRQAHCAQPKQNNRNPAATKMSKKVGLRTKSDVLYRPFPIEKIPIIIPSTLSPERGRKIVRGKIYLVYFNSTAVQELLLASCGLFIIHGSFCPDYVLLRTSSVFTGAL